MEPLALDHVYVSSHFCGVFELFPCFLVPRKDVGVIGRRLAKPLTTHLLSELAGTAKISPYLLMPIVQRSRQQHSSHEYESHRQPDGCGGAGRRDGRGRGSCLLAGRCERDGFAER